ncbi:MAG: radical SAM protein [Candidatus Thermoplasmatota archaeon]
MNIHEIFYSIQGEGILAGIPTIFIRTTGCNLRCSYCDTTYAYHTGKTMSIPEIVDALQQYPCSTICLTGGEPLMQPDCYDLLHQLLDKNYKISVETNGSISIQTLRSMKKIMISLDYKCPSSHMHTHMNLENINLLRPHDQLKFIIQNSEDYSCAREVIEKYHPSCYVFFQPVWGTDPKILLSWILQDGLPVRLGLQLHKILWGDQPGV